MMHASTSPLYQLFAALDVNAKMHEGEAGKKLWIEAVKIVIETRKQILRNCHYIRPLVPPIVNGKKWEDGDTEKWQTIWITGHLNRGPNGMALKGTVKDSTSSIR